VRPIDVISGKRGPAELISQPPAIGYVNPGCREPRIFSQPWKYRLTFAGNDEIEVAEIRIDVQARTGLRIVVSKLKCPVFLASEVSGFGLTNSNI
jgi:hypothetical protein